MDTICIDCAVRRSDFREVKRGISSTDDPQRLLKAVIGGKRYILSRVGPFHVPCDQCGRVNDRLYVPHVADKRRVV
jgi:hypothetical protein